MVLAKNRLARVNGAAGHGDQVWLLTERLFSHAEHREDTRLLSQNQIIIRRRPVQAGERGGRCLPLGEADVIARARWARTGRKETASFAFTLQHCPRTPAIVDCVLHGRV